MGPWVGLSGRCGEWGDLGARGTGMYSSGLVVVHVAEKHGAPTLVQVPRLLALRMEEPQGLPASHWL